MHVPKNTGFRILVFLPLSFLKIFAVLSFRNSPFSFMISVSLRAGRQPSFLCMLEASRKRKSVCCP